MAVAVKWQWGSSDGGDGVAVVVKRAVERVLAWETVVVVVVVVVTMVAVATEAVVARVVERAVDWALAVARAEAA